MRLRTLSLHPLLQRLQSFVCKHKVRQVARVGVRGFENGPELVLQTAREGGRSVHTERANELESNSKVLTDQLGPVYLPLLNRKVITRA